MRPLRKIPAGILLPLAELIFGERISLSAESDQGAALDLRFFEKNRVKLFCHYFRQKVLFCYQLPTRRVCKDCYFAIEAVGSACMRFAAEQRDQVSADTAPVGSACMRFAAEQREQGSGSIPPQALRPGNRVTNGECVHIMGWALHILSRGQAPPL